MKYLIIVVFFLIGCSKELPPTECNYCGGDIHYHQTSTGGWASAWTKQSETIKGKKYHPWCKRILEEKELTP